MAVTGGVFPCYENQFQINTSMTSTPAFKTIADCETFGVSFDNGVEEWTPFESEGWIRRLKTAMGVTISVSGKRNIGDDGNDFVSGLSLENGQAAQADFKWTFPDGTVVTFENAVINVTNNLGGDATNVAPLEFEVLSNGKPTISSAS